MSEDKKRIYLIDGSGYMFRAYYGTMRQRLSNSKGVPTGGTLAFARMLLKVIRERAPEYVAIAFDRPEPTFRHEIYPAYKGNRDAAPEDLVEQIPYMHRVVEVLRIPLLVQVGAEADDIIGTLAARAEGEDYEVVLVTADKDFAQLVSENVRIWDPMKDEEMGPAEIEAKWGVPPGKFVDIQALMGDSTDNIPGVPGIGEKTAVALIQQFGGLEEVLASTEQIKRPKQRENIEENVDMARLSRELCTIKRDLALEGDLESCRLGDADIEAGRKLFVEELEFKNIIEQLPGYSADDAEEDAPEAALAAEEEERDYHIIRTTEELGSMIAELEKAGRFAFDLETTSLDPMKARIVGFSFSAASGRAFYVPVGHEMMDSGPQLPLEDVLEEVSPLLESVEVEKIGQNIKYDIAVLKEAGHEVRGPLFDTMLASYLLLSSRRSHGMDHLAQEYFGVTTIKYADLCGKGAKEIPFSHVPVEAAAPYACQDADITYRLAAEMAPQLENDGLMNLFEELEVPLLRVLLDMERAGIRLDREFLRNMGKELEARLERMTSDIHDMAGETFNINSTQQLRVILFEKLNLPVIKRTKTGPIHRHRHAGEAGAAAPPATGNPEFPAALQTQEHLCGHPARTRERADGPHPRALQPDGRRHGPPERFGPQPAEHPHPHGSGSPDTPGIPARGGVEAPVRGLQPDRTAGPRALHERPGPGRRLRQGGGHSRHDRLGRIRRGARRRRLRDAPRRQGGELRDHLRAGAPSASPRPSASPSRRRVLSSTPISSASPPCPPSWTRPSRRGRARGYVSTIMGRRRYLPDLNSRNRNAKNAAERTAVNSVIQGSAADIIKLAMIAIADRLKREEREARMLVQVHDELLFEIPPAEIESVAALVTEEMRGAMPLHVPLDVDVSTGENWGELK